MACLHQYLTKNQTGPPLGQRHLQEVKFSPEAAEEAGEDMGVAVSISCHLISCHLTCLPVPVLHRALYVYFKNSLCVTRNKRLKHKEIK